MKISLVAMAVMVALQSEQYNKPVKTIGQALVLAELEKEQNMDLPIQHQDNIRASGASACRAAGKDNWKLNPYQQGTVEHDLWLGGYESEAESMGSQGKDW